ncbi:MAG: acetyl-CoA synthetase, partial [Acidobacteria bacterium]|nr:acetyl-CoA synthetase [Acidobacteriota bacterium]
MTIDLARIQDVLAGARARIARREGTPAVLLETEGLALLAALGIPAPRWLLVNGPEEAAEADTSVLGGDRVVVKVISPRILHKSDVGGVKVV